MYLAEFANVYDALMDDVDYRGWAAYYCELAGLGASKLACECGCGTGSMTLALAQQGIKMMGADLSEGMLRVASEKARARGMRIPFICQDMCALALHRGVDAVLAPCDGVNYLLDNGRVRAFFDSAFGALKPGGVLAFDVSTPSKLHAMDGQTFFEDRDEISYFWVNEKSDAFLNMSLTFFVRQADGLYRRFDEEQTQRAHARDELLHTLADAGFESAQAFGDKTFTAAKPEDSRWHFRANRPYER